MTAHPVAPLVWTRTQCSRNRYPISFRHKSICGRRQTPLDLGGGAAAAATAADSFSEAKFAADAAAFPWLAAVRVDGKELCSGVFVSRRDG